MLGHPGDVWAPYTSYEWSTSMMYNCNKGMKLKRTLPEVGLVKMLLQTVTIVFAM